MTDVCRVPLHDRHGAAIAVRGGGGVTIPAEQYHQDRVGNVTPSLSSSIAKILVSASPAHAFIAHPRLNPAYQRVEEDKFSVGTVAHQLLLEGVDTIQLIDAPDWRTNAAKEARDAAKAAGRIPLLPKQAEEVLAMVEAARLQIAALDIDPLPLTDGLPEQTIVWEEDGALCRARIDWLHDSHRYIDDIKTSARSAHPDSFQRTIFSLGYEVQACFYRRGVRAVFGVEPEFRFIVQETVAPYELSVVGLDPAALALGDAKVDYAIATWKKCLDAGSWPGYPRQVCYVTAPAYEEMRWLEREQREVVV